MIHIRDSAWGGKKCDKQHCEKFQVSGEQFQVIPCPLHQDYCTHFGKKSTLQLSKWLFILIFFFNWMQMPGW